jgi:hypothetical protein
MRTTKKPDAPLGRTKRRRSGKAAPVAGQAPALPANSPAADDAFDESHRSLQRRGWSPLPTALLADWACFRYAEQLQAQWHDVIVEKLQSRTAQWGSGWRPGGDVAAEVSAELQAQGAGIMVSATHPATDGCASSPRWYASIIEAAWSGLCDAGATVPTACGTLRPSAPRPSRELADVMWGGDGAAEGARAWITELGWTIVPPGSAPQELHADICADGADDGLERRSEPRFTHFFWKADRRSLCTTQVAIKPLNRLHNFFGRASV